MKNGKRIGKSFLFASIFFALSFGLSNCKQNIGLGETIDTKAPELEITYPSKGAIIMEDFYVAGTCGDDKSISKVEVILSKQGTSSEKVGTYLAEIDSKQENWKLLLNEKSDAGEWTLSDGSYSVDVTAYDAVGNKSGTSSLSFTIDNTPPVFVATNPGVAENSDKDFSSYGSSFSLEGKLHDENKISQVKVKVYDKDGTLKTTTPFTETDLNSGSISLLFARRVENSDSELNKNYETIYGTETVDEDVNFTCSVTLTDEARLFKDIENPNGEEKGNTTSTIYLNDDIYDSLLSSSKGLGLNVSELYSIINGTYTGVKDVSTVKQTLLDNEIITVDEEDSSRTATTTSKSNRLGFSLNPNANPTYSVAGYTFEDRNSAATGNQITISANSGKDKNQLLPKTFKVWIKEFDKNALPSNDELKKDIASLLDYVNGEEVKALNTQAETSSENSTSAVKTYNSWNCLSDNSSYNGASVSNYTMTVALNADIQKILMNNFYIIVVTGEDQEGLELSQSTIYGFVGTAAGMPPVIDCTQPVNLSYEASSDNLVFSGNVEAKSSIVLSKLKATVIIENENTNQTVKTLEIPEISFDETTKSWTNVSGFSAEVNEADDENKKYGSGTWTLTLKDLEKYDAIKTPEDNAYLYTLKVEITATSGHTAYVERSVHIDTIKPSVEITGITPVVNGSDFDGSENIYLNGNVTFQGTLDELNNIEGALSYQVLDKEGKALSLGTNSDGSEITTKTIAGRVYSFKETLNTTNFADKSEIEIVVSAKDKVGNTSSYSSKTYNSGKYFIVEQESDKPVINVTNADSTLTDETKITSETNSFSKGSKLSVKISDDDGINDVTASIYRLGETTPLTEEKPVSAGGKTSYDFTYNLPNDEGIYQIVISATDINGSTGYNKGETAKFAVLIDNSAPIFKEVTLSSNDYVNSGDFTINATIEEQLLNDITVAITKDGVELESTDVAKFVTTDVDGKKASIKIPSAQNDGTYSFTITATDILGKSEVKNVGPIIIDTVAPVVNEGFEKPTKDFVDKSSAQKFSGTITETTSGVSDIYYYVKGTKDGQSYQTTPDTGSISGNKNDSGNYINPSWKFSADLSEFDENTSATVHFYVMDNAGNKSAEKTVELKLDSTSPVVAFTAPNEDVTTAKPQTISGTVTEKNLKSLTLTVSVNGGASSVAYEWTGEALTELSTGTAQTWSYTMPSGSTSGNYVYKIKAEDLAGQEDSDESKAISFDIDKPTLTVDNSTSDSANLVTNKTLYGGENNYITVTQNDDGTTSAVYNMSGTWSDNLSGTKTLQYKVGSGEWTSVSGVAQSTSKTPWSVAIPLTEQQTTKTSISLKATDSVSNETEIAFADLKVDFAKPVIKILSYKVGDTTYTSIPKYIANGTTLTVEGEIVETNGLSSIVVTAKKDETEITSGNSGYTFAQDQNDNKKFTITLVGGNSSSGNWTFDINATDVVGRNAVTSSLEISVDMTAPVWKAEWGTDKKFKVENKEYTPSSELSKNWYSGAALSFNGCFEENGSGIQTVYYWVSTPTNNVSKPSAEQAKAGTNASGQFSVVGDAAGLNVFNTTISGFEASSTANNVYFAAVDVAGNVSSVQDIVIYRDNIAPSVSVDGGSQTKLTNGVLDIQLSGIAEDDASGISELTLKIQGTTSEAIKATLTDIVNEPNNKNWKATIPASVLATLSSGTVYSVEGTVKDAAGNQGGTKVVTLSVDKDAPVVKLSDSLVSLQTNGINGSKNISGSVEDSSTPSSLKLFYTLTDPSASLTPADNSGSPTGWTLIESEVTDAQKIYNWSQVFDFTSVSGVLAETSGTKNIYILPVCVDSAGNCNAYSKANNGTISWNLKPSVSGTQTTQYYTFKVDASLDRPKITFSDLQDISDAKDASSLIIKSSEGGVITGLAEDDDGIEEIVISSDAVTSSNDLSSKFTKSTSGTAVTYTGKTAHSYTLNGESKLGYDTFVYDSGSWTFTPAIPLDGTKNIYIYVKDSNGTEFYSTATASTGYTTYKNPRIKIKNGSLLDNTAKLTYTSDNNNPVVSSIEVATNDSSTFADDATYSYTTGMYVGGSKKRYAKFKIKASDSNGISEVELVVKHGTSSKTYTLGGSNGSLITGNKTTDSTEGVFYTEAIDLKELFATDTTVTEINVSVTVKDGTSMAGSGNIILNGDFAIDESGFKILTPTATQNGNVYISDDTLTASVTVSGMAIESKGEGIENVQWMVAPCDSNGNEILFETLTGSSASTYDSLWSTGKSSDTVENWSFIFDQNIDVDKTATVDGKVHFPTLDKFTVLAGKSNGYALTNTNGVYFIPLYFKITDKLGNVGYKGDYVIRYNPDADRPTAKILYPTDSKDVGDVIRVSGSAEDNVRVETVYFQLSSTLNNDGSVNWSSEDAKIKAAHSAGSSANDTDYMKIVSLTDSGITNVYNADSCPTGVESSWWGIKADNTISWSYSINKYLELNPTDGKTPIYLRACAVDNQKKASVWSDVVKFNVVTGVPSINFESIELYDSQASDFNATPVAKNLSYQAGDYLTNVNGQWYLKVTTTHSSGIQSITINSSVTGSNLTETSTASNLFGSSKYDYYFTEDYSGSTSEGSSISGKRIYIPVNTSNDGDVIYTITVTEASSSNKSNTLSFTYKVDNVAPSIGVLTSGNTRNTNNPNIAGNKIVNANGGIATIQSDVTEDNSGFTMMAYYFVRNGKIFNPIPATSNNSFVKQNITGTAISSLTTKEVGTGTDKTNFYGLELTGASTSVGTDSSTGEVFFEAASSISDSAVRAGGLILIDGIYYQISKVDGAKVYVKGLSEKSKATTAFAPYVLVVQYDENVGDTNESFTSGSYDSEYAINEKDGDGILEQVTKAGSSYKTEISIMSDSIPDGEIDIVCVAFDKAGNISSSTTKTMISNNLPRVSKIFLATDLNQDSLFTADEFVYKIDNNGVKVDSYAYSCLDSVGNGKEVVTLETTDAAGTKFAVKDKLAVTMELLTGANPDGSYADLSYIAELGSEASTTPATAKTVTGKISDSALTSAITVGSTSISNKGIIFAKESFVYNDSNALSGMNSNFENSSSLTTQTYLQLTLWDNVNIEKDENSTYIATLDTEEGEVITKYGNQFTLVNIPLYIDISDDVAPAGTVTPFFWNKKGFNSEDGGTNHSSNNSLYYVKNDSDSTYTPRGHIEIAETPSVSGIVVLQGEISDDQLIGKVELSFMLGSTATTVSSTYTASTKTWGTDSHTVASNGYHLIVDGDSLTKAGHSANWTLYLDTAKLGNATGKTVTVTTTQAKTGSSNSSIPGTTQSTTSAKTGYYAMNVVPYITKVDRGNQTSISSGKMNRSRFGRYAVSEGETITVYGYNFGTSPTVTVGITTVTATSQSAGSDTVDASFTITVPSVSGNLTVINTTSSLNNSNTNTEKGSYVDTVENTNTFNKLTNRQNYYNMEVDTSNELTVDYTDDRYLSVWALGNYFKGTDGGVEFEKPVLTSNASGDLFASWGTPSNGSIAFSYGMNQNKTSIFNCYDQPSDKTSVAFDKKGSSGAAAVLYFGEQQGNGGTWSNVAIASNTTIGGAFTTQITRNDISNKTSSSDKRNVVSGNPSIELDGDNTSGFYTLGSYDMQRRLGAYSTPANARHGNYLHNVWYDKVNESLKYSVINLDESNITNNYAGEPGAFAGWVVLDGGYTGQDRIHTWISDSGTTNQNIGYSANRGQSTTKKGGVKFANDVFMASPTNKDGNVYDYLRNNNKTLLWNTALSYDCTLSSGATIAILDNTKGAYKIVLRKLISIANDKKSLTWEGDDLPTGFTPMSFAIYGGNMNVVGGSDTADIGSFTTTNQSSSAGLSADIDVTTDGKPVVAYYDAANSKLKVVVASDAEPDTAAEWTRYDTGKSCTGEVSIEVDGANGIHIMYKNTNGKLCYIYADSADKLSTAVEEVIDSNGTLAYGSLSVISDGSSYIPCITYLNTANTADCIKYAYRKQNSSTASTSSNASDMWDYMIVPSMGSGHYAIAENTISLEGRKSLWSSTDSTVLTNGGTTATPATVDAVIAFKSKQFETAYLKKE